MKRHRTASGFTLIELLVVVGIISVIVSMTIFLVGGFLKGSSVKEGGRIVQAAFARARQQASTTRLMHFMVFDFASSTMRLHVDKDRSKTFTGVDPLAGEAMNLPYNCYFDRVFGDTSGNPYAAFQSDGSCVLYNTSGGIVQDVTWAVDGDPTKPPSDADIILRLGPNSAEASDKVYIDLVPAVGLIRKIEYYHLKY